MTRQQPLPIDPYLEEIVETTRAHGALVLLAPPGAGKTTRVPAALLNASLFGDQKIIVLQPRRVAARTTARRIAWEQGDAIGQRVGYRVRFENQTSTQTRLEVMTEGLLTRKLQTDPFLEDVGCIVFDEFHERSLNTDLSLALVREIQNDVRPDLKIVIMSATLDPGPIAEWLSAPTIEVPGRTYPVEITYDALPSDKRMTDRVVTAVKQMANEHADGHILCFLPGVGEINRCGEVLQGVGEFDVIPLHGRLPAKDQDRAFADTGRRKLILATNIAETSVTIDGVRIVIDSGLARQPVYDRAIGMERLETVHISQASADQRAGRAGRTAPGHCRRLWTEHQHRNFPTATPPEIQRVDLTGTVLEVMAWGATPEGFGWFEPPSAEDLRSALALLRRLGATDERGVTPIGNEMVSLPLPPRISRALLSAKNTAELTTVATIAAMITERDVFYEPPDLNADCDLELRLDVLRSQARGRHQRGVSGHAVSNVLKVRDQLLRALGVRKAGPLVEVRDVLPHLLTAFSDRVARRRKARSERVLLAGGSGARMSPRSVVREPNTLLALSIRGAARGQRTEHTIELASMVPLDLLKLEENEDLSWDEERRAVQRVRVRRYGALIIETAPASGSPDASAVAEVLATAACSDPGHAFGLSKQPEVLQFLLRVQWLRTQKPEMNIPEVTALKPSDVPSDELRQLCMGHKSFSELGRMDLLNFLRGQFGYQRCQQIDRAAPSHLTLPDGTHKALQYREGEPPILATRFERLFGLSETPTVAGEAVTLHLLAPNMRPIQVTSDLAGFWANTYAEVRKELRGRYPKHPWPDDPLTARPGIHRKRR